MTEKKPGEPDEADHVFIEKILGIREYFFASLLATYREEIESRAKREFGLLQKLRDIQEKEAVTKARREGAREALERAKEIAAEIMYIVEHRRWHHENSAADFEKRLKQCHEKAETIRALADQPEAEGKSEIRHTISKKLRAAFEPQAPAKADALPLGHEFVPSCYDESGDWCAALVPFDACGQPEAAHGRKP